MSVVRLCGFAAEHSFEWNFLLDGETTVVEPTGNGSFPVEAEVPAMQDMYIKVQEVSAFYRSQVSLFHLPVCSR